MNVLARGAAVVTVGLLGACGPQGENEAVGTIAGAVIGGFAGSAVGDGTGRDVAIASGAVLGALIGGHIGRRLDEQSQMMAQDARHRALDQGTAGQGIRWDAPDNSAGPAHGVVMVNRSGQNQAGRTCREYTHEVTIAGETEVVVGTACLGDDGRWTEVA